MVALDSLYAMLARPVVKVDKRKRVVEQTEDIDSIHADSHEAPQSQLPPHLERRRHLERRTTSRGDRRGKAKKEEEQQKIQEEVISSPLPHIDIDV
ncbi:hypothetical protein K0I73_16880 [Shewanella mesophila]|uniref:hypothetical protein n=1 Tax=Shewanella mesophila TaxID=2864208 RepID=UPI001C65A72C|nr:hypothetical protein [Shewanella mesophila]QYJ85816.1 hypothetical protein K0I73_16880 [Shewanella mesophila]